MADSSTALENEVVVKDGEQAEQQSLQTNTAESSDAGESPASSEAKADEGAKPQSMLEAVKLAIEPAKPEAAKTEGEEKSPDSEGGEKESEATSEKPKGDEDEKLPFHKHPRWQQVLHEKKAAEHRLKELEPTVRNFEGFQRSVVEAGLSAQEIDEGFEIMKLMKSNPAQAYEALQKYMAPLAAFVGQQLPEDLQGRVDAGTLDPDSAQELARARNEKAFAETRVAKTAEQREREAEEQQYTKIRTHLDHCAVAVTKWETEWKGSDPDYAVKQPLVDAQLAKLNQEQGVPKTVEDAVERAKEARSIVEKTLAPVLKKTTEKRTVTGGSSATQAAPKPKTLREAIALAARAK